MKPIVGVMPLWDEKKDSIWMLPGYLEGIEQAGGVPVVFPLTSDEQDLSQLMELCDGFLFTGGHDVSPDIYFEKPLPDLVSCCRERDDMELVVLKRAIEANKPVLGICRGIQFINAALGGTLYQDLPSQRPTDTEHHQNAPYDVPCHRVDIVEGTPLHNCLGLSGISVNSCHHQGIRRLSNKLEAMALAPDGLIEAVHMPSHRFLWAVQWHPEFSCKKDDNSRLIFSAFVKSML